MSPATVSEPAGSSETNFVYANDVHITEYQPLISPALLMHDTPVSEAARQTIARARGQASAIISGKDDRLLVVVGPCSIHNVDAALEYAQKLKALISSLPGLVVVMRAYFESECDSVIVGGDIYSDSHFMYSLVQSRVLLLAGKVSSMTLTLMAPFKSIEV
jgi:phospho-2-dehydro-3-deoxyheptonate aldolase